MSADTYGYRTKRLLPAAPGKPKVCTRCTLWFLAGPRERACEGCLTYGERTRRAARRGPQSDSKALETEPIVTIRRHMVCPLERSQTRMDPFLRLAHKRAIESGMQACVCQ